MPRYLIQQPNVPDGLFGTITTDSVIDWEIGQVTEMPVGSGEVQSCVVRAIERSPKPDYDALIVFGLADDGSDATTP